VSDAPTTPRVLKFGVFELDPRAGELRKLGMRQKLAGHPMELLIALVERPQELVTREELRQRIWPDNVFLDFDLALKKAVNRSREALGDSAENPRFIETIPRRGYRFIAPVTSVNGSALPLRPGVAAHADEASATRLPQPEEAAPSARAAQGNVRRLLLRWWSFAVAVAAVCAAVFFWLTYGRPALSFHARDSVLIADFENHTGDQRFDDGLQLAFTISLEQSRYANVFPRGRIPSVLERMERPPDARITPALGREICQRENLRGLVVGEITRTGQEYAVSAQLIDPQTNISVRSHTARAHGEDQILDAMDKLASSIRGDLGESLYQISRANRPLPEVTTRSITALKQYADGILLWHHANFKAGVEQYQAAVATDPGFAMAHAALGKAYCSHIYLDCDAGNREYEQALAPASRVTERERLQIQAEYERDMGHDSRAQELTQIFLSQYPDDQQERFTFARSLRQHGQVAEAVEQYKILLQLAPNDDRSYVDLATSYKALGNFPEALRAYSETFRLEPNWLTVPNVNREYGFTLVKAGQEDKAKQIFATLLKDPEKRPEALRSLALLDLMHGRYAAAQRQIQSADSIDEDTASRTRHSAFDIARDHFLLAVVARGEGDTSAELRQLDAALANFTDLGPKVEYASLVGQQYARAGATGKAEKIVQMIEPLVDNHNEVQVGYVRILKGEIAFSQGHLDTALDLLAMSDLDYSNSVLALAREAAARVQDRAGRADLAVPLYEDVLRHECYFLGWDEPHQLCFEDRLNLASDYVALGDMQKASDTLASLLDLWKNADPDLPLKKKATGLHDRIAR
jgi:eukaryotic-like serine/threonine-protein kinase